MFKYIAGNTIKQSINTSKKVLTCGKIPIINYAIEETKKLAQHKITSILQTHNTILKILKS